MRDIIGQRLKELRTEITTQTQEKIAKALNISREAYSLYETNKRQMNYDTICAAARLYNVSTDYLLGNSSFKKSFNLSTDEITLLNFYRNSDKRGQKAIIEVAKIMDPK